MIVLQMLRKMYPLLDSGNPGCCRLCGSVKDVVHVVNISSRR